MGHTGVGVAFAVDAASKGVPSLDAAPVGVATAVGGLRRAFGGL